MYYIAIGKFAWGKGKTQAAALANMRKHLSDKTARNQYVLFETDDKTAYVNWLGNIVATSEPREIKRVGIAKETA